MRKDCHSDEGGAFFFRAVKYGVRRHVITARIRLLFVVVVTADAADVIPSLKYPQNFLSLFRMRFSGDSPMSSAATRKFLA